MALVVEDIVKNFGEGLSETKVLKGIKFEVEQGEFVILNGASGSGKTTLLTILGGLLSQTSGTVLYNDTPLFDKQHRPSDLRLEDIGFIFQSSHLVPYLRVIEQLTLVGQEAGMTKTTKFKKSNTTFEKYWFRRSLECISASVIWR
ncbi:Heme efflux system ATPase HrtA [Staphylococcus aureus]|uniref:Heme efflux system ATPase HrtA n=1 Tax=Staphylococcus aureus TaxID=1280 RepID=A0A380DXW3_STAAU|nr:Heme efflux system ATPase HrtA [Staphylococcus aureus]